MTISNEQIIYSIEELKNLGFTNYKINRLVKGGKLIKLNKGYYENKEYQGEESDFYYVSAYTPKGIICLMSAASFYNLTTFKPDKIDVAIHRKSKMSTIPNWPILSINYYSDIRYEIGSQIIFEGKNSFRIYDIEKTVIDIICFREKIGIEETKEILINYLNREDRNLNKLLRYAQKLKCSNILKTYLEVLI